MKIKISTISQKLSNTLLFLDQNLPNSLLFVGMLIIIFSIYKLTTTQYPSLYAYLFSFGIFFSLGVFTYKLKPKIVTKSFNITKTTNLSLSIIFFITYCLIILILINSLYVKGILFYLLVTIASVITVLQILLKPDKNVKIGYYLLFFQIMPLAFIVQGSSFLINPYMMGPDVPWHFHSIEKLIATGFLNIEAFQYYYYPLYHTIQAINAQITGLFSAKSFEMFNLLISVGSVLIMYSIGKELFNEKIGLICAFIFAILTTNIFLVIFNTSKIGGTALLLISLFLLIKKNKYNNIVFTILFLIVVSCILLWHPEIALALMLVLGAYVISQFFITKKLDFLSAFLFYVIFYVAYLLYVNQYLFTYLIQSIFITTPGPSQIQSVANNSISVVEILQYLWAYLGISASAFFIAFMGIKWLKSFDKLKIFILISLIFFYLLPAISTLSGNFALIPERILSYYSILSIIMFAIGFFKLFTSKDIKIKGSVFLTIFMVIFILSSMTSYLTGDGNNLFSDDITKQTIYATESTVVSYDFLNRTPLNSKIGGDYQSITYLSNPMRGFFNLQNHKTYSFEYLSNISLDNSYFLINKLNLFGLNFDSTKNGKIVNNRISQMDLLYNNGNIEIYR